MHIDVLTLFPDVFGPVLSSSIVGRAVEAGIVSTECIDIRGFATDKHRSVDDRPFGGGPGMVLMCDPVFRGVGRRSRASHERGSGRYAAVSGFC